jgi:PadR family transcriptional regulator, regulatory protein PadR
MIECFALFILFASLQREKYLLTCDEPFQGRKQCYYKITKVGKVELQVIKNEWNQFKIKVAQIYRKKVNY